MQVKSAEFICSNTDYKKCPKAIIPEYAFIGRSNVGKSSLINSLTNKISLAKISGKPGKTQLINHFHINDNWYLVDLPGYGYAKVSKKIKSTFDTIIQSYLLNRVNLLCTFVLIDIRHEPQNNDLEFLRWMGEKQLPFALIFTKADKLTNPKQQNSVSQFRKTFLREWEEMPMCFVTSAAHNKGLEPILKFIEELNGSFTIPPFSETN